ncbi:hypothetical protein MYSTI_05620 [Myxococcus stipitatus DSM 14675]|uniref:Outer membrane protein beta-barrel domain-containing protein n=1 Tax=Myxococcus stipitatus (strain DSM 14675 / JCM 12634 / Mx s8) TaxID=1278073 RepID=L7UH77_MYXSD|nr:hypothetical protein [Myxococcus stipitatus]AGC46897.1 hypothetical protein MYSTI_05620 [Myxococcus stipitatus DSM 14675]
MNRSGLAAGLLVVWLLLGLPARAESRASEAPWYVPDHASLQFAGSLGMLAAGPGWAFLDEQVDVQVLLGWAPRAVAGADFVTLTLKAQWHPFHIARGDWSIRPLTVGAAFSYTFGDRYFLTLPDRYEPGYYWFKTALRPALLLGGSVGHAMPELGVSVLEGYYELVATDYRIVQFVQNPLTVNTGLFSLALGARLRF